MITNILGIRETSNGLKVKILREMDDYVGEKIDNLVLVKKFYTETVSIPNFQLKKNNEEYIQLLVDDNRIEELGLCDLDDNVLYDKPKSTLTKKEAMEEIRKYLK